MTRQFDLRAPSVYVPMLFLLVAVAAPLLIDNSFFKSILIEIMIAALLGVSWNILGGYAGQLSLGHSAFYGIGAYTSTLLLVKAGVPVLVGMLLGGLLAMLVSIPVGLASFRLRGPYFSIATIAMAETLRLLMLYPPLTWLTFGAMGTTVPLKGNDLLNLQFAREFKVGYYFVGLTMLLIALAVTAYIERSRLGYYLVAVGQDEDAAEAVGIRAPWVKQQANFVSSFFAALAGTLGVQYVYFVEPESAFGLAVSVNAVLVAIVGGVGTLWGPVIGALLLTPISNLTQAQLGNTFPGAQLIVYSVIMIVVILFRPSGLTSVLGGPYKRLLAALPGASIDRARARARAPKPAEEVRGASPA